MMKIFFSSFLLATTLLSNHVIANEMMCIKHCHDDSGSELKFETSKQYLYQVKVSNEIVAKNNEDTNTINDNLIRIDGQIRLQALNKCEVSMQFEYADVQLISNESYAKDDEIKSYERQLLIPIIFSYHDGNVPEVCLSGDQQQQEEPFVLNVKKSIISALQTISNIGSFTETNITETDYHGECDTDYKIVHNGQGQYSVLKRKDLLKCRNVNESDEFSDIGFIIEQSSEAHAECHQNIESHHITKVDCRSSRSLYTMLDQFDIDLISRVQMRQVNVTTNGQQLRQTSNQKWSSDKFQLKKSPSTSEGPAKERVALKTVLTTICDDIKHHSNRINIKTLDYVHQLREAFRYESAETIESIWKELRDNKPNSICTGEQNKKLQDVFIDTAASMIQMNTVNIIRDELLRLKEQAMPGRLTYLASLLAFAKNPSAEAVQRIVPELLDQLHDSHHVLSVSALIKSVESKQITDDYVRFQEEMYKKIVNLIEENIIIEATEVQTVRLFIALENVSPLTMVAEQEKLLPIIFNSSLPDVVRVVAIKSLDAVQPTQVVREGLMRIFADRDLSNEIRVIAYRTLIRTGTTAAELQLVLDVIKQENGHMFNYVCSHQKMLRKTMSKVKSSSLPKDAPDFPEPASMFQVMLSRHYEYDQTDSKTGITNIFETDVIMANGMFLLPRSVTLNITIAIGASEMAMAEVTIRQEGFEGSIRDQVLSEIRKTLSKHRIDTATLVSMVQSILSNNDQSISSASNRRIQILVNLRGRNIFLYDSYDNEDNLLDLFKQQIPIRVDETMIILPWQERIVMQQTSSGVPMYLELNSTYIASLDLEAIHHQNQSESMDIFGGWMFKPTLVARNQIGFGIENNGKNAKRFQVISETFAAPTIHLQMQLKQSKQLLLRFLLPEQQQQVWLKSQTFMVKSADEQSTPTNLKQSQHLLVTKCSADIVNKMMGLSVCVKTRDSSSSLMKLQSDEKQIVLIDYKEIVLRKENKKMEAVELQLEMPQQFFTPLMVPDESRLKFAFAISTPISGKSNQSNRCYSELIVQLPDPNNSDQLSANFSTNFLTHKYKGHLKLIDSEQVKLLQLQLENGQNVPIMNLMASGTVDTGSNITRLNIEAISQQYKLINGRAMIANQIGAGGEQQKTFIKFDLNNESLLQMMLYRNRSLNIIQNELKIFNIRLQNEWSLHRDRSITAMNMMNRIRYSHKQSLETHFEYKWLNSNQSIRSDMSYKFLSSQFPSFNTNLTFNHQHQNDLIEEKFVGQWGRYLQSNELRLERKSRKQSDGFDTRIDFYFTPSNSHYLISAITKIIQRDHQRKVTVYDVKVKDVNAGNNISLIESSFQSNKTLTVPFRIEKTGQIKFNQNKMTVLYKEKIDETQTGKYRGQVEIKSIPESDAVSMREWPLKQFRLHYTLHSDISRYEGLMHLMSRIRRLKYDAFFDSDRIGHCGQMGYLQLMENGNFDLKNVLRREGELIYDLKINYQRNDQEKYEGKFDLDIGYDYDLNVKAVVSGDHETLLRITSSVNKYDDNVFAFEAQLKGENGNIDIRMPKLHFEHETKIIFKQANSQLILLDSQTRYDSSNRLNINMQIESLATCKLVVSIEVPSQQIYHQTKADWTFHDQQIRLMDLSMKNYVGDRILFDVYYKHQANHEQQQTLVISTRMSHVDLCWTPTTVTIDIKSKLLGGIHHQTELKQIQMPSMKLISSTELNGNQLFEIKGDLMLKSDERSSIQLLIGNDDSLSVVMIPWRQLIGNYSSSTGSDYVSIDRDEKHFHVELQRNEKTLFQIKAQSIRNFLIECDWRATPDSTERIMIESKVEPQNNQAQIKGQWFEHEFDFECESMKNSSLINQLNLKYKNLESHSDKNAHFFYDNEGNSNRFRVKLYNDNTNLLTGDAKLEMMNNQTLKLVIKTRSGKWNLMNLLAEYEHHHNQTSGSLEQVFLIQVGSDHQQKSLKAIGQSNLHAIFYEFKFDLAADLIGGGEKMAKLEWNKDQRKLQLNVYDGDGRIADLNVDLWAKTNQKKLQLISFTDWIPTIDAEAAFGDDSHLLFAVNFQKEKKLKFVLNWFGQWRRDYRTELMLQSWTEPQFDIMIESHHPSSLDAVNVDIKYRNRTLKAQWNNHFDDDQSQQEATVQLDGRQVLKVDLDRVQFDDTRRPHDYRVVRYEGRLGGDYSGQVRYEYVILKQTAQMAMVRFETDEQSQYKQHLLFEIFYRYQEQSQSPRITGINIERNEGKPILIASYIEPPPMLAEMQTQIQTLAHLYVAGGIDYQMLNEIQYESSTTDYHGPIRQVTSKMMRKGSIDPILTMKVDYYHHRQPKEVRVEIESPEFNQSKVLTMKYFNSCQKSARFVSSNTSNCTAIQIIPGQKSDISFSVELMHDQSVSNQSLLIALDSFNQTRMGGFTLFTHMSPTSLGAVWVNQNTNGQNESGRIDFVRNGQPANHSYDAMITDEQSSYELHLDAKNIRNSFVHIQWNLWRMIVEKYERFMNDQALFGQLIKEIQHKLNLFQTELIDDEMINLIMKEYRLIVHSMQTSDDQVAHQMIAIFDRIIKLWPTKSISDQIWQRVKRFVQRFDQHFMNKLEIECLQNEKCQRFYNKLRDYEMHEFVRHKLLQYFANPMLNVFEEPQSLAQRIDKFYQKLQTLQSLSDLISELNENIWAIFE